jgi:hypothetical protein
VAEAEEEDLLLLVVEEAAAEAAEAWRLVLALPTRLMRRSLL